MKLILKRDAFAGGADFLILDECARLKYRAAGKRQKLFKYCKINIFDRDDTPAGKIRRLSIFGMHIYALRAGRQRIALVTADARRGMMSRFYGNNWFISGDFGAKRFSVIDVDKSPVMSLQRIVSAYELTITDENNELFCVMTAVCACLTELSESFAVQTA